MVNRLMTRTQTKINIWIICESVKVQFIRRVLSSVGFAHFHNYPSRFVKVIKQRPGVLNVYVYFSYEMNGPLSNPVYFLVSKQFETRLLHNLRFEKRRFSYKSLRLGA